MAANFEQSGASADVRTASVDSVNNALLGVALNAVQMLDEIHDLNDGERAMMKMWNHFIDTDP